MSCGAESHFHGKVEVRTARWDEALKSRACNRKWTVPGVAYDVGAGYVEEFDMYTLCTVRGAGHEGMKPLLHCAVGVG